MTGCLGGNTGGDGGLLEVIAADGRTMITFYEMSHGWPKGLRHGKSINKKPQSSRHVPGRMTWRDHRGFAGLNAGHHGQGATESAFQ